MIDLVAELDALLAAWRERRASTLARGIDELSSWFALALPLLDGKTRNDRHAAWLARSKQYDAVDVPAMLETVPGGSSDQTTEQLERIAAWPADPRTTWLARRMFSTKPYATSSGTQKVWRRLFDVLAHHGDPRATPLIWKGAMVKVFDANERGQKMRLRAENVLAELEQVVEKTSPDDDAWVTRIERELASGRELRDAVRIDENEEGREQAYADALLVYRDWLMERGFVPA